MKKLFCFPALELFRCLPLWKTVLFVSSRPFLLSTPTFLLSTLYKNSEATWKKATKCNKISILLDPSINWFFQLFLYISKSQLFFPIWILIVLICQIWETSRIKLKKHSVSKNVWPSTVWVNCSIVISKKSEILTLQPRISNIFHDHKNNSFSQKFRTISLWYLELNPEASIIFLTSSNNQIYEFRIPNIYN